MDEQVLLAEEARRHDVGAFETPVPVIDLDCVERNIRRLQAACDAAGIANRPHIKTHKSIELMRRQLTAGAAGITCQKIGEAEVMADAGAQDILISYNILGTDKLRRLRALAGRVKLSVACDNAVVARGLSEAFADASRPLDVLVEIDTGRGRCGVVSPEEAVALAALVDGLPGLAFAGLMSYAPEGPPEPTRAFVAEVRQACAARGLAVARMSAGGTPNIPSMGAVDATEYRSGTSIFNDRQMLLAGAATLEDCALHVYATVVSRPTRGRAILDAGSKTLTSDLGSLQGHGFIREYPEAIIYKLAEEHGFLDISACPRPPEIGEVVRIVPNHVCPVVNLFDEVQCTENGRRVGPMIVSARGRVS